MSAADEIVIEVGERHIREVNEDLQEACTTGKKIRVVDTLSRHNLVLVYHRVLIFTLKVAWVTTAVA